MKQNETQEDGVLAVLLRLEKKIDSIEEKVDNHEKQLKKIDSIEEKLDSIEEKVDNHEKQLKKIDSIEEKLDSIEEKVDNHGKQLQKINDKCGFLFEVAAADETRRLYGDPFSRHFVAQDA